MTVSLEVDREWFPIHRPLAHDAPIPGQRAWHSGCSDDQPRVDPATGLCEGCGGRACPVCGRERCPDNDCEGENA